MDDYQWHDVWAELKRCVFRAVLENFQEDRIIANRQTDRQTEKRRVNITFLARVIIVINIDTLYILSKYDDYQYITTQYQKQCQPNQTQARKQNYTPHLTVP